MFNLNNFLLSDLSTNIGIDKNVIKIVLDYSNNNTNITTINISTIENEIEKLRKSFKEKSTETHKIGVFYNRYHYISKNINMQQQQQQQQQQRNYSINDSVYSTGVLAYPTVTLQPFNVSTR